MLVTKVQNTSTYSISEMCAISESILPGAVAEVEGLYLLSQPHKFTTPFKTEFVIPGKH